MEQDQKQPKLDAARTFPVEGNPNRELNAMDYTATGEITTLSGDVALVVGSAVKAEAFITTKQWGLLWRDSDLLYQSPRPMSVYENTYVLEPNVQRFTVAKVCNAIVPQLYKGLFYDSPPMVLRPRPGTSQDVVTAKTSVFDYLLTSCNFKRNTKWGLEQMAHLGTGIWKWGIEYVEVEEKERVATVAQVDTGRPEDLKPTDNIVLDVRPKINRKSKIVPRPFFNARPLDKVLVDSKTRVGDIQESKWVIDVRYMDFYELMDLKTAVQALPDGHQDAVGWQWPGDGSNNALKALWMPPSTAGTNLMLATEDATHTTGIVHHSENENVLNSPDLLRKKYEVLEYWDKKRKILVIDRKHGLFSGDNPFKKFKNAIPFYSANWWNRPKAFYGMGLGLIVGQNQRVDQGTINAILKILSFGVNPIYLRRRDANTPTQMIRTGIGKILTVDVAAGRPSSDAYSILEQPKVPGEIWTALQESNQATESSSGADAQLVQGSSAGPRSSMGRTAGGAAQLGAASATRLDGPLDNFITQVFEPFLYTLDELVFEYISDAELMWILGEELGKDLTLSMQKFHEGRMTFEVLAGASLAAKRIMAQSLTLITQIFENPQIQQNLAEINEEYIDFKPILNMWMEASEWKNRNDIIKPLTPAMKKRQQEKSAAAQAQSKMATQMQLNSQKGQMKAQQSYQENNQRIQRDLIVDAFRKSGESESSTGMPSATGLQGSDETGAVM